MGVDRSANAVVPAGYSRASESTPIPSDQRIKASVAALLVHYWTEDMPASMRAVQANDWLVDLREFGPEIVSTACTEWRSISRCTA